MLTSTDWTNIQVIAVLAFVLILAGIMASVTKAVARRDVKWLPFMVYPLFIGSVVYAITMAFNMITGGSY